MHAEEPKFIHVGELVPRPGFMRTWEKLRHAQAHWLVECVAEFVSDKYAA